MSLEIWFAFIVTSSIILLIPGPTILTVISASLSYGHRAKAFLITAVALGDTTALALSLIGLGALLKASAFWFVVVKSVGALYLLFLGLKLLREGVSDSGHDRQDAGIDRKRLFLNTYLVTALNPKGIVFFVAFLPQFTNPSAAINPQLWLLAVTFVVLSITNAGFYSIFAASTRKFLSGAKAQRILRLAGGSILSAAGIYALLSRRHAEVVG